MSLPELPDDAPQAPQAAPAGQAGPAATNDPERFTAERAALAALDQQPLVEHAGVFGRVHAELQAALAEIDGI